MQKNYSGKDKASSSKESKEGRLSQARPSFSLCRTDKPLEQSLITCLIRSRIETPSFSTLHRNNF